MKVFHGVTVLHKGNRFLLLEVIPFKHTIKVLVLYDSEGSSFRVVDIQDTDFDRWREEPKTEPEIDSSGSA